MTWLAFVFALEAGIIPQNSFVMYQYQMLPEYKMNEQRNSGPIYFTDLQAELIFFEPLSLFVGGRVRFQMSPFFGTFNPESIFYEFITGIRYKGIELYYLHACQHPQMTSYWQYKVLAGWEGAYDEIGIKFSGKIDLVKDRRN
jgi:hypothetical protein